MSIYCLVSPTVAARTNFANAHVRNWLFFTSHDTDNWLAACLFQLKLWGAVRKNIKSDRFSTKTAISARI